MTVSDATESSLRPRQDLPFFIVGNPRSGTTLLRFILSSHSRIYIPEETGFLAHLQPYMDRSLTKPEVRQLVEQIADMNQEWQGLVAADEHTGFFEQLEQPDLRHVLDHLYRLRIAPQGAERWGDKGPSYVRVIPTLERIFPDALYIHMIRDGRDSSMSALKKWGEQCWYYDMHYLMTNWARNIRAGQQAGAWLGPERYLEVRYETLVANSERVIRSICDFLGESFEPAMLDHTSLAQELVAPTGHFEVEGPVTQRTVGHWKKNMSLFDQKVSVSAAGETLERLGYDLPELPAMTFAERLQHLKLRARFLATDTARTILYKLGMLTMNRAKSSRRSN